MNMKMTGHRIRKAIDLPFAAFAVPALCTLATVLISANARAQAGYWLESATDERE